MLSNILILAAAGCVVAQNSVTEIVASATSLAGGDAATSAVGSAISGDTSALSAASSFAMENPSQASEFLASYASQSPSQASSALSSFLATADPSVSSQVASAASNYFPGGTGVSGFAPMPTNGTNGVAAGSAAGASASRSAYSSFLSEASASASGSSVSCNESQTMSAHNTNELPAWL
jgi:hypothetical protein